MSSLFVLGEIKKLHNEYETLAQIDQQGAELLYIEKSAEIFFGKNVITNKQSRYIYDACLALIEEPPSSSNARRWATNYLDFYLFLKDIWNIK